MKKRLNAARVMRDLRKWSLDVLEKPSDFYAGLPPCPYAKTAWSEGLVFIHVIDDLEEVSQIKGKMPVSGYSNTIHVCCLVEFENLSAKELENWIDKQNENHFGVWLMGFHPDSPESEGVPEYVSEIEDDFVVVLVQSLSELDDASRSLEKTGYYDRFDEEDTLYFANRRRVRNAWKEKVDEESYGQSEYEEGFPFDSRGEEESASGKRKAH